MITTERSEQNSAYGGLGGFLGYRARRRRPPRPSRSGGAAAGAGRPRAGGSSWAPARGPWASAAATWLPALTALLLYGRTLGFAFVWDDLDLVVRNAALQGEGWARLLAQDFWASTGGGTGMWRPLVTLSYRLDGVLSGWQPWSFHLANALAHAGACLLVARLAAARGAGQALALAAGLAYASAPALSEAVAWIAGRTDAFASLATLAALLLARRWRERGGAARLAGALGCGALALLAKESALVLPLLLAADAADARAAAPAPRAGPGHGLAVHPAARAAPAGPGAGRRGLRVSLAALALVALWALAHRAVVPPPARAGEPGSLAGAAALVWAHLAWLAPWAPHSPLLEVWIAPPAPVAAAGWLALALAAAGAVWLALRRVPHVLPGALLLAPLLPVSGASLLESGVRFAERSLALPVAGLSLALAALAGAAPGRLRRAALAGLGLWVAVQAAVAWSAIGAWRDEESRLRRIAAVRPEDPDALLGLADLLSTQGRESEARDWIARAGVVAGGSAAPEVARASLDYRSGRFDVALAAAERALALAPRDLAAGVIRVRSLARLGRHADGVRSGEALVASHPGEPAAEGALGAARLAAADAAGALPLLERASAQLLDDGGLAWDLGRAALATGDLPLALEAFERATRAEPRLVEAWLAVADVRHRLGDRDGAEAALARADALAGAEAQREALRARIRGR